jgi:transcription initiation factor IIF auxiliary subunit
MRTAQETSYQGNDWWKWWIWIECSASELEAIESVTYRLHPTLPNPVRKVTDRGSKFRLESFGWSEFTIPVKVTRKDGTFERLEHYLVLEYPAAGGGVTPESEARRPFSLSQLLID